MKEHIRLTCPECEKRVDKRHLIKGRVETQRAPNTLAVHEQIVVKIYRCPRCKTEFSEDSAYEHLGDKHFPEPCLPEEL